MTRGAGSLAGRRVIVTRAVERAGALSALLRDAGAEVVEMAVTTTLDASDGGAAFRSAVERIDSYDWVVVTSPEGARRLARALEHAGVDRSSLRARLAAVGRATAEAIGGADLVPTVQTGMSLGEAFPLGSGRVLLAVAESARDDFASAARAKGWAVERVHSYRTVAVMPAVVDVDAVRECDAITFTASSSVEAWVAAFGTVVPPMVVAMGPQTADALRRAGIDSFVVAADQTLPGIVAALTHW